MSIPLLQPDLLFFGRRITPGSLGSHIEQTNGKTKEVIMKSEHKARSRSPASRCVSVLLTLLLLTVTLGAEYKVSKGTGELTAGIPVIGTIFAVDPISITHPVYTMFIINPNAQDPDARFVAVPIEIRNDTVTGVSVKIQAFRSVDNGQLVFQDILPGDIDDWDALTRENSSKYIALSLILDIQSDWSFVIDSQTPYYAASTADITVGHLQSGGTGIFHMDAYHGLAFDSAAVSNHEIIFIFNIT